MSKPAYEKNVYLAMLAEQCNRFEEMTEFLVSMLKTREKDLNSDERNLLSIAFKNSITPLRTSLRTIIAYETKEKKKESSAFLAYIQEYRAKVQNELSAKCDFVITTIEQHLIPKASTDHEALTFYYKMIADYHRYNAEYASADNKTKIAALALEAYNKASEHSKSLSSIHPINLGLQLNFSVFYYEVINDHNKACEIAKNTLDNANKDLPPGVDDDDENHRDALSIINLLKENLDMWSNEDPNA
jgi:14-3-3 protein epsilon